MKYFLSRLRMFGFMGFFLCVLAGGTLGFFSGGTLGQTLDFEKEAAEGRFKDVSGRFGSDGYRTVMNVFGRLGSMKALDEEISAYGEKDFPPDGDWEAGMSRLLGRDELVFLLERESAENVSSSETDVSGVAFPEISLLGVTFGGGGKRAVTVMSVNGGAEIWLWEKTGEKEWRTDAVVAGFGVKNPTAGGGAVRFILYSIENAGAMREYAFDAGSVVENKLAEFISR